MQDALAGNPLAGWFVPAMQSNKVRVSTLPPEWVVVGNKSFKMIQ